MTSQAKRRRRPWVLGLALGAALALCATSAAAATYEEGGAAATAVQRAHWTAAQLSKAAKQAAWQRARELRPLLPPSGKKPSLQQKAAAPR